LILLKYFFSSVALINKSDEKDTEKTGGNGHTFCAKYSKYIKGEIYYFM
tara:strand:+ start:82 stop:228 length:147 start_codon:yes stop_codon:yes gene_type:complete